MSTWNPFGQKPTTPPQITKPRIAEGVVTPTENKPTGRMKALAAEESRIERGLSHFRDVGEALKAIRDKQLFANNNQSAYLSWGDYLQRRWKMSEAHASRLISAADVVTELSLQGHSVLPATESQARPMASLSADQVAQVWSEVVATTPPEAITALAVEEKALKYRKPKRNRLRKPAAVKIKGKGWKITIERSLATIDVEAVLIEAIDRLKDTGRKSEAA
ncbi:MAG: hypothetical protein ACK5PD_01750 [Pirellulaceae bacterium]